MASAGSDRVSRPPGIDVATPSTVTSQTHVCRIPARRNSRHINCRFCACGEHKRGPRGPHPMAASPDLPAAGLVPRKRDPPLTEHGLRFAGTSSSKSDYSAPQRELPKKKPPAAAVQEAVAEAPKPRRPTRWEELRGPRRSAPDALGEARTFGSAPADGSSEYHREYVPKAAPRNLRHTPSPLNSLRRQTPSPGPGGPSPAPAGTSDGAGVAQTPSLHGCRPGSGTWGRRTPARLPDNLGARGDPFDSTSEYGRQFGEKPLPKPEPRSRPPPPASSSAKDWASTAKSSYRQPAEAAACPCVAQPHAVSRPVST
eukprot:TRINITY_DN40675_c0_g1_i1.p1 TRINITY_DN40675_c0_g1~~TRINITY_DN40675_c0_g1_i1.p1  ORF type:complete len:329 (+),score=28.47 TRINITY_DN40675_c0_g1_i1:50-988(+)